MIEMTLGEVADVVGGALADASGGEVVTAPAVVDNRLVEPGGLFAAFAGEHVDGHDFAAAAVGAGAAGVLGSRATGLPTVVVEDPQAALQRLAAHLLRRRRELPTPLTVVAITGSQGKTSAKDMLAAVLGDAAATVATHGSFNNELGLPLTVLRTTADTAYLVLEMGARGIGHLAQLTTIARPDVSLVLNVGRAHIGEFGSQRAIAQAKGELVEALSADGTAVLNADDPLVYAMAGRTAATVRTFGTGGETQLGPVATDELGRPTFELLHGGATERVTLNLVGEHHARNAAAVAATAVACGVPFARVAASLRAITRLSRWRMELHEPAPGIRVLNDAYNANPDSMAAALNALATIGRRSGARTVAVLGGMRELGEESAGAHAAVGALVRSLGIDRLVVVAEEDGEAALILDGTRTEPRRGSTVWTSPRLVPGVAEAVAAVREDVGSGPAVVLVKASRGARLERVAEGLLAAYAPAADDGAANDGAANDEAANDGAANQGGGSTPA